MFGQTAPPPLRIALAEATPLVRRGVEAVVHAAPALKWVGGADSTRGAVDLVASRGVDVMVVGPRFDPDWSLSATLSEMFRSLLLVALVDSGGADQTDVLRAGHHGVSGLVAADTELDHLVVAIRATADLGHYLDPALRKSVVVMPVQAARHTRRPLTARELEVLGLVAEGRTAVYIGRRLGIAPDTVRTHVSHVLSKLGARDRAHAVARAFDLSLLGRSPARSPGSSPPAGRAAPGDAPTARPPAGLACARGSVR